MDREVPVGNRLINERMREFRTKKHRETLSMIKTRGNNIHNQTISSQ
jgi:hypothetical protein